MEFGVQSQTDLGGPDAHELGFVALHTSKLSDHIAQDVIL